MMYVPSYLKYIAIFALLAVLIFFGFKYVRKMLAGVTNAETNTVG